MHARKQRQLTDPYAGSLVSSRPSPSRRIRAVALACGLAILLIAVTWVLALATVSPSQRAASAEAPPPKPIVASVQRGVLDERINARCVIAYAESATQPLVSLETNGVVTHVGPSVGDEIEIGSPIIYVNDRPVFALTGPFPLYRDLHAGDQGADVMMVQDNLRASGFTIPDNEYGTVGDGTVAGLTSWYLDAGSHVKEFTALAAFDALVFDVQFPARMEYAPEVGTRTGEGVEVTVASGEVVASAEASAGVVARVKTGLDADISIAGAAPSPATVSNIEPGNDSEGLLSHILLSPESPTSFDAADVGLPCVASITIKHLAGTAFLVPTRAVSSDSGGVTSVLVDKGDEFAAVQIDVIAEFEGVAAVEPKRAGELTVGDEVVIDENS